MNITIEETMEMPDVVLFARRLNAALEGEQKKRQHFYKVIDENAKMEFINGEIYFESPAEFGHIQVITSLSMLLTAHVRANQLGIVATEKLLISLTRNDYEPDVCFFRMEKSIGFKKKQMQFPPPDLVVEVLSETTARRDRGIKFDDYEAHAIPEYWIIDPETEIVEQYELADGKYQLLLKSKEDTIESVAVAGFAIPIRAIFDEELSYETLKKLTAI